MTEPTNETRTTSKRPAKKTGGKWMIVVAFFVIALMSFLIYWGFSSKNREDEKVASRISVSDEKMRAMESRINGNVDESENNTIAEIRSSKKELIDTMTSIIDNRIDKVANYLGEKVDDLSKDVKSGFAEQKSNWEKYKSNLVSVRTIQSAQQKSSQVSRSQRDAERRAFVNRVNKINPGTFPNSMDEMDTKEEPISSTPPTTTSFLKQSSITSNLSPTKPDTIVIIISVKGAVKYGDHPWLN